MPLRVLRLTLVLSLFAAATLVSASMPGHASTNGPAFLVKDITAGPNGDGPNTPLMQLNGILLFVYQASSIWRSNGTALGTTRITNSDQISIGYLPATSGNKLLFSLGTGSPLDLWKSDGTASGTALVKRFSTTALFLKITELTDVNETGYFILSGTEHADELWKTDGTAAGTVLVKVINAAGNSVPRELTNVNGTLFFAADDGSHGCELWKSNGTATATTIVLDRSSNAANLCPTSLLDVNGRLYFAANDDAHGSELWKSDGTPQGTVILQDINPGPVDGVSFVLGYQPLNIGEANGTIYFAATDGQKGYELWKTNGTPGSTTLVKDINPGPGDSIPSQLRSVNGTLFFSADDGSNGCELWKSDGTAANTVLVKAINPDPQGMCPDGLVAVGSKLIFTADDGTHGSEMWLTDGTPQGTAMVQEIKPGNPPSVYVPIGYQRAGPFLFFIANDGTTGTELWAVPVAALGVRESNAYLPLLRR